MELSEVMDQVTSMMRQTKEDWVATKPDQTDLMIYLHFFRDEGPVAVVQSPLERDIAMHAAWMGATGFAATIMTVTFEAYSTTLTESPVTGKPWRHQEMQFMVETNTEAIEKGWVFECLTTSAHTRGGDYAITSQPYRIKDGQVEWQEPSVHNSSKESPGGGAMFDYLQGAMKQETIAEKMARTEDPSITMIRTLVPDKEVQQFHTDMATSTALQEKELAIMVALAAEQGSVRHQMIAERVGHDSFDFGYWQV